MTAARPAVDIDESRWRHAVDALGSAGTVALACHVSPDADALGSMLALGLALRRAGGTPVCSWGDPRVAVPGSLDFLPGQDLLVQAAAFPAAPDVMVTFDTGSRDRLGALAASSRSAGCCIVVDHHARGDGFGDLRLVDTGAAATALVVEELISRLGVPLDAEIAACLYAGLLADTGSFRFASTTPDVLAVAGRLMDTGIAHDEIARRLFDTHSTGYLRLLGAVLERLRVEPGAAGGRGLAWTWTEPADLDRYGVASSELEALIGTVRTVGEVEVAVVCKADPDGALKVSTRSKGAVDVGAVCASLGGGGHAFAAGYTSTADLDTTMVRLRAALDRVAAGAVGAR